MYLLAINKIYEEGYIAYSLTQELGKSIENPYQFGTEEYQYWFKDWDDSRSDYEDYYQSIEEDYSNTNEEYI